MKTTTKTAMELIETKESPLPLEVIPNNMGINLCSVDALTRTRQERTVKALVGQDLRMLLLALSCAIEWNESLIDAHTPTLIYKGMPSNPHMKHIRRWRSQIKSWRRLINKLSNMQLRRDSAALEKEGAK
jgi:3-deoxy-D-arabino-heptulosonate 7-phosphate (DAHP) synthase